MVVVITFDNPITLAGLDVCFVSRRCSHDVQAFCPFA